MKYDKPVVAAIIGAISAIPYELFTRLLLSFGIGRYSVYQLSSLMITLSRPTTIMGFVVVSVLSSTISVMLYYALSKIGSDYLLAKSILASLLVWIALETIFVWLIEGPRLVPIRPVSDYYLHMFGATIFGLTMGLLMKKYIFETTSKWPTKS